jgi:hemerythrin-like domain-containing protein
MILTDQLRKENETIRAMLEILDKICDKLDSGDQVSTEDLDELIQLAEALVERLHQRKEEDLLLSTMERSPVDEHGAMSALLLDHRAIRRSFQEMKESVAKYHAGDQGARPVVSGSGRLYSRLLREHLDTAEKYLYGRADVHLSRKKQSELSERFDRLERFGVAKDKLLDKLLRLMRIYIEQERHGTFA